MDNDKPTNKKEYNLIVYKGGEEEEEEDKVHMW